MVAFWGMARVCHWLCQWYSIGRTSLIPIYPLLPVRTRAVSLIGNASPHRLRHWQSQWHTAERPGHPAAL
jgi:hypothetical protein